jgi:hypothetical protein
MSLKAPRPTREFALRGVVTYFLTLQDEEADENKKATVIVTSPWLQDFQEKRF